MRRLVLISLLCLAMPAAAGAQSSPFGPLPQPAAPAPTAAPIQDSDQSSLSRSVLFGIAGGVLILFVAIGTYITRDARSHLTDDDRRALERQGVPEDVEAARVRSERAKKKQREKTRAQKQARKKSRR